ADKNCATDSLGNRKTGLLHYFLDTGKLSGRRPRKQVIQRKHRMCLAAAEVGLQFHHRIAASAAKTVQCLREQPAKAFGNKRPPERLVWVLVLVRAFLEVNLP